MKKNYLITCLVQAMIFAVAILFSFSARSQQLTEAQKQERCQNNKNRITELETQLRVIDAELSQTMTKKEIEDARTQMVHIRWMKNSKNMPTDDAWKKLDMIAAQYNFRYKDCLKSNLDRLYPQSQVDLSSCIS